MLFSTSFIFFSAALSASSMAVPRHGPPATWWTEGLEDYNIYHARYQALSCASKHNTDFFDKCCHPLLKTESLALNRAEECDPDRCDDTASSLAPAPAPTPSSAAVSASPITSSSVTPASSSVAPVNAAPAPSSAAPAPKPSSSAAPKPSPKPTSSTTPAPSPSQPASNVIKSGGGGDGTFFFQHNTAGSCGKVHSDDQPVVALDFRTYSASGDCGSSDLCGRTIHITNTDNGKSVDAIVADCCPTCTGPNSVDMSVGAFTQIAAESQGLVPIKWEILG